MAFAASATIRPTGAERSGYNLAPPSTPYPAPGDMRTTTHGPAVARSDTPGNGGHISASAASRHQSTEELPSSNSAIHFGSPPLVMPGFGSPPLIMPGGAMNTLPPGGLGMHMSPSMLSTVASAADLPFNRPPTLPRMPMFGVGAAAMPPHSHNPFASRDGFGSMPAPNPSPAPKKLKPRIMPPDAAAPISGSGGLDICFVMDCTSSMSPWIVAAKTTVKDMIAALPPDEPEKRVAFVAYRDFHDGPAQVCKFTEDVDAVVRFIDSQDAEGGMDIPEDVAGGLAAALSLKWRAETRTVVLVTDAPCHGKKYHDDLDDFPDGDPTGLSMVRLMRAFRTSHIDFTFVQLQSGTDKMQRMLKAVYESAAGPENIRKYELRDLRDIIEEAGGAAAMSSEVPAVRETVSCMLSAAVTPTINASVSTSRAGVSMASMPVRSALSQPMSCMPGPHLGSAPPRCGGPRTTPVF